MPKSALTYYNSWLGMVLWMALTTAMLGLGGYSAYEDHLFATHARPVTGTVDSKSSSTTEHKGTTTAHYTLNVRYRFNDRALISSPQVTRGTYDHVLEGDPLPLKVLPENPHRIRVNLPEEVSAENSVTWVLLGLFAAGLLGTVALIWLFRRFREKYKRLLREGVPTQATITRKETPALKSYATLYFNFRDDQGGEVAGYSSIITRRQAAALSVGDKIPVRYDSKNPGRFALDLSQTAGR